MNRRVVLKEANCSELTNSRSILGLKLLGSLRIAGNILKQQFVCNSGIAVFLY